MEFLPGIVALISLAISVVLAGRVLQLERRLQSNPHSALLAVAEPPARPLQGLRVVLAITQDHAHPVFANLLKEQLLSEDVTDIILLTPAETAGLRSDWKQRADGPDLLIAGDIVCNGYAEIYYTADLTCSTADQAICNLTEKPPHGDRPSNLAIDLVARLKTELEKLVSRDERRQAIRELQGP